MTMRTDSLALLRGSAGSIARLGSPLLGFDAIAEAMGDGLPSLGPSGPLLEANSPKVKSIEVRPDDRVVRSGGGAGSDTLIDPFSVR